jgi:hypothetical protein
VRLLLKAAAIADRFNHATGYRRKPSLPDSELRGLNRSFPQTLNTETSRQRPQGLIGVWEVKMATQQQIENYAYLLWEKAGRPEGRDIEFYHAAEVELNEESDSPDAPTQLNDETK